MFLMELVVDYVSRRIQFGLIMGVVGAYFVVWLMVIPICNDFDPVQVLDVDVGKFPAYCPVSCHQ